MLLPSNSFIKVGMILGKNEDSTNVIRVPPQDEKNLTIDDDLDSNNTEVMSSKDAIVVEDPLSESKELTIETMDVETFSEMYSFLKRKNRIYNVFLFILIMTNAISMHHIHSAQERERTLNQNLEKLSIENTKLMEQITIFENKKQEQSLCYDDHTQQSTDNPLLLEVNNCYFNFQASATLGQCSKDIQNTMQNWYDRFVYESYVTFWEEYYAHKSDEDGSNGTSRTEEHSTAVVNEPSSIEDLISFII